MKNFEGIKEICTDERITLYYGSKSGICDAIAPISRKYCDFGKGFYMGTDRIQTLTLICNYPNAKIYTLGVDLSGLKIFDVDIGLDCPSFIDSFMHSKTAAALDDIYDRLQWAGEEYILEELDDEVCGLKKAGTAYSLDVMYWIGYTYRYWYYYK